MTTVPRRSRAKLSSRARRWLRLPSGRGVATAAAALAIAVAGAAPSPAPAAATTPLEYVVLIDGLCSSLPPGVTISPQFTTPGGLVERLAAAGRSKASIVTYSYQGGSVGADGTWQPDPYGCADSRDQGLVEDVDLLNAQLAAILEVHPAAVFHLVGFSQGGLVAFAELARLATVDDWTLPNEGRIATVVSLDSPLGGLPFVDKLCGLAPDVCGGRPVPDPNSSLFDMAAIWQTGTGQPAGADRSVASLFSGPTIQGAGPLRNEALAIAAAAEHGIQVLTIGNVRDWVYAPLGAGGGPFSFLDGQWLTNGSGGLGVYARTIDSGPAACPAASGDLAASYGCNHNLVLTDPAAGDAVVAAINGATPALATRCPAGTGGCVTLPPRPAIGIDSAIAAGVVGTGGRFGTAGVIVASGGRATLRFSTVPALAGARLEIWARSRDGTYHRLTSRIADAAGVARYTTPPVTAWTAYQGRYAGDFVHGPGVSAGRVVTIK